jgi:hypothetical protein
MLAMIRVSLVPVALAFTVAFSALALAAPPKKAAKPAASAPAAAAPAPSSNLSTHSVDVYAGPSFALLDGNSGFGVDVQVYFKRLIEGFPQLDLGFETGLAHYSLTGGSTNVIPILPAALWHIDVPGFTFRTYAGLAVGLGYYSSSQDINTGFGIVSRSDSGMKFMMLLKPGALFEINPELDLYVEPKFGFFDGKFNWLPTVGVVFRF